MENIWYFEDVNLYKLLCPHKYKEFKKSHKFLNFNKKDYIYFEEDAANRIYLIDKGKVKLGYYTEDGDEIVKAILSRGEIFGEKAILGEEKRNEFAQSIDNSTTICAVPKNTMLDLMRDNVSISFKIYKFIGFRIQRLERRLQSLLFKDARTRLLDFIQELAEDYGKQVGEFTEIQHPYTQKEISTLIGVSRPTLNTLMNELKTEGVLNYSGKKIQLF